MSSHNAYSTSPSAPPLYPDAAADYLRPVPPVRSEFARATPHETLLPPRVPPRMDDPVISDRPMSRRVLDDAVDAGLSRVEQTEKTDETARESACNYNRYATKKTIAQGFFIFALITSNAMQLRTLILQKQHDTVWIVSLILICLSIVLQFILAFFTFQLATGDIRNSRHQLRLERLNTISFLMAIVVSLINVVINGLMLSINPKSFLDGTTLDLIQNRPLS